MDFELTQIDPKAKSPRQPFRVREHASKQRPRHTRNTKHARHDRNVERPFLNPYYMSHERQGADIEAPATCARDQTPHDESARARSCGADDGASFEDEHGSDVHGLDGEERKELAEKGLHRHLREEVGRHVPGYVVEAIKLGSYARDGGRLGASG